LEPAAVFAREPSEIGQRDSAALVALFVLVALEPDRQVSGLLGRSNAIASNINFASPS
jgi:hypothetical protein